MGRTDDARRGDDVIDIALDVDAGLFAEFFLTLFLRQDRLEALPKLRIHDLADVGKRHDSGVSRDVAELRRS
jgi:hypothetical protein